MHGADMVYTSLLHYTVASSLVFYGIPECMSEWDSASCTFFSWAIVFLFVCPVQLQCDRFCFVSFLFCYILLSSLRSFFLMRDRNYVNLDMKGDSKELGGIEGVKTVMKIYYVKKKSLFSTN